MYSPSALIERLNESSAPYRDPVARLNWDSLDLDIWWLPPQAVSLAGVVEYDRLPFETRMRLSQFELVHVLEAGLWLEAFFIECLAGALDGLDDLALRSRMLHEIREEAGHGLMFIELMERSGVRIPDAARYRPLLARGFQRLLTANSALFWPLAVICEELPDKLNRTVRHGVADATISALVYHMTTLHIIDEARHIAHSRAMCSARSHTIAPWRKVLLSPLLARALKDFARFLFYPPAALYRLAGLPPAQDWRRLATSNPQRRQFVAQAVKPTSEYLQSEGWQLRAND